MFVLVKAQERTNDETTALKLLKKKHEQLVKEIDALTKTMNILTAKLNEIEQELSSVV
jgi:vacuolar-type H+-ATPase subunit D/Vma8